MNKNSYNNRPPLPMIINRSESDIQKLIEQKNAEARAQLTADIDKISKDLYTQIDRIQACYLTDFYRIYREL